LLLRKLLVSPQKKLQRGKPLERPPKRQESLQRGKLPALQPSRPPLRKLRERPPSKPGLLKKRRRPDWLPWSNKDSEKRQRGPQLGPRLRDWLSRGDLPRKPRQENWLRRLKRLALPQRMPGLHRSRKLPV